MLLRLKRSTNAEMFDEMVRLHLFYSYNGETIFVNTNHLNLYYQTVAYKEKQLVKA